MWEGKDAGGRHAWAREGGGRLEASGGDSGQAAVS